MALQCCTSVHIGPEDYHHSIVLKLRKEGRKNEGKEGEMEEGKDGGRKGGKEEGREKGKEGRTEEIRKDGR